MHLMGSLGYYLPKLINGLKQGNSQLIFLVPKTDCTNISEQMIWTAVSRQGVGFIEVVGLNNLS